MRHIKPCGHLTQALCPLLDLGLILVPSSNLALKARFLGLGLFLDPCTDWDKANISQFKNTSTASRSFLLESGGARRPCLMAKCFKQLVPSQDSSLEDDDLLDLTFVYVINMINLLDMNVCILPYRAASGYHREGVRRGAFLWRIVWAPKYTCFVMKVSQIYLVNTVETPSSNSAWKEDFFIFIFSFVIKKRSKESVDAIKIDIKFLIETFNSTIQQVLHHMLWCLSS